MIPDIVFYDHIGQSTTISDRYTKFRSGLLECLKRIQSEKQVLTPSLFEIDNIEINFVSDTIITELHDQFLDDPTPTDVITFQHGELFVSYDTAKREAHSRNIDISQELYRYCLHGILHLAGYSDLEADDYHKMHILQESLVELTFEV